jgi:hypothetical protein
MNIPPIQEEGYYDYSLRVRGIICSQVVHLLNLSIQSFPLPLQLLKSMWKNPLLPMLFNLCMSIFMIIFVSCFVMGKVSWWGMFTECKSGLGYCVVLGPLFWVGFENAPNSGPLPCRKNSPQVLCYINESQQQLCLMFNY